MSERDFHAEAVKIVADALRLSSDKVGVHPLRVDLADLARISTLRIVGTEECERRLRAEALIRQMVEMSKEEGLVDFYDWVKAAEKYLEGK